VLKRIAEPLDLTAIDGGDVRMNIGDIGRHLSEARSQLVFSCLKLAQAGHHAAAACPVFYHRENFLHGTSKFIQFLLADLPVGAPPA
jgi:hypothetical protein